MAVHTSMLQCLEPNEIKNPGFLPLIATDLDPQEKEDMSEKAKKIISIADEVISMVDSAQILAFMGMKNDARADAGKIKT